jgi:aminoglycoside/choline kinase family phosphotransferase
MRELVRRTVDAEHLTALLASRHPGVEVASVAVLDESSGSANRLRLAVDYAPGGDAGLPPTMFLKRNLERFGFPAEMYANEVRIYRDVLPGSGLEAPAVYAIAADVDDVSFEILMEDLGARADVRIGHVCEPTTPDDVDRLLATLARLHAAWWGGPDLDRRLPWVRPPASDPGMRFWREVGPRLARRHVETGHRAALVDRDRWPLDELWRAFDRMVDAMADGPPTLLHGDVHAGNVYHVAGGDGGLLDWQLALRGCWALDVTYLLTSALTPEDRRATERDLLAGYLDRLRASGVDAPPRDEAWTCYRRHAVYGVMMWLITPDGVHTDEAQREYLRRCLAAADDLETLVASR